MAGAPGEWSPADATKRINACAASDRLNVSLTFHARERMGERDLLMADVLHVLKTGSVYEPPIPASREGFFKYQIEGKSPSSSKRFVRVVVIPDGRCDIKIVTVMWKDE